MYVVQVNVPKLFYNVTLVPTWFPLSDSLSHFAWQAVESSRVLKQCYPIYLHHHHCIAIYQLRIWKLYQHYSLLYPLVLLQAAMPENALDGAWKRSAHKLWVKRLRRTSSLPEFLQVWSNFKLYYFFTGYVSQKLIVCYITYLNRFSMILLVPSTRTGYANAMFLLVPTQPLKRLWFSSRLFHKQHQLLHYGWSNWMLYLLPILKVFNLKRHQKATLK